MKIDVAAEVADCLKNAPGGDSSTDQAQAWLFTSQNSVAVRLRRIVDDEDKAAHDLLTERAARTWGRVTNPEGKAQRLWARLSAELLPLAQRAADGLERRVDFLPEGMLAKIFPPETTCREVAALCYMCCESPLAIKADLIFPYHGAWMLLPGDRTVRKWTKWRYAADAVEVPPVGDFVAAMVMNRLGMVKELLCTLVRLGKEGIQFTPESINREHELGDELRAVRNEIWDTPDDQERAGALALLQVYLALEEHQSGFEADWSVIPWPAEPENTTMFIIDRPEEKDLFPTPADSLYLWRARALSDTFDRALKDWPGDVAKTVKGGLEWLLKVLCEVSKRPKCRCGGQLHPDEQRRNVLICPKCGKRYADTRKLGPPAPPTGHVEEENGPSTEDIDSCRRIAADVRKRPEAYRQAGQWLDQRFSLDACMKRLAEKVRLERRARECGPMPYDDQTEFWCQLRRNRCGRAERRQRMFNRCERLLSAADYWLDKRNEIIGEDEAQQIVLVTALLLDPDADRPIGQAGPVSEPLTEFLSWPWGDRDDFRFAEHVDARQFDRLYTGRDFVWSRMSDRQRHRWIALAKRAGKIVADRDTGQEDVAADYAKRNRQPWDDNNPDFDGAAEILAKYPDGEQLSKFRVIRLYHRKLGQLVRSGKYKVAYMENPKRCGPSAVYVGGERQALLKINRGEFAQMVKDYPDAISEEQPADEVVEEAVAAVTVRLEAVYNKKRKGAPAEPTTYKCNQCGETVESETPVAECPSCHKNTMFPAA